MNRHRRLELPAVIHIQTNKDPRPVKAKLYQLGFRIGKSEVESAKCGVGNMDAPLAYAPVDDAGRILSIQRRSSGEMRIVEGYKQRRSVTSAAFNADVARAVVANAEN